jgi:hypothetical protein
MKQYKQDADVISRYETGIIHQTEILQAEAELAERLIGQWGMVACVIKGETAGGYNKLELQTPEQLIERGFETARLFFEEAHKRNLVLTLPNIDDLIPDRTTEKDADEKKPRKWLS